MITKRTNLATSLIQWVLELAFLDPVFWLRVRLRDICSIRCDSTYSKTVTGLTTHISSSHSKPTVLNKTSAHASQWAVSLLSTSFPLPQWFSFISNTLSPCPCGWPRTLRDFFPLINKWILWYKLTMVCSISLLSDLEIE